MILRYVSLLFKWSEVNSCCYNILLPTQTEIGSDPEPDQDKHIKV